MLFDIVFSETDVFDDRSGLMRDFDASRRFNLAPLGEGAPLGDTKFYVSTVHDAADIVKTVAAFATSLDAEVALRRA